MLGIWDVAMKFLTRDCCPHYLKEQEEEKIQVSGPSVGTSVVDMLM